MKKDVEIWKDIVGYEGLYQASNWGRVKSLERVSPQGHLLKEKILRPNQKRTGYLSIALYKNGKRKDYLVHRLVAEAFLDNPDNLPCINHISEIKTDNRVENLEFCSYQYNNNYGTKIERISKAKTNGKTSKIVYQYTIDGEFIGEYPSLHEVERQLKYDPSTINKCCLNKQKTSYGFIWRYK